MNEAPDRWPFTIRPGFTLRLGRRVFVGGEIVDLTEAEAFANKHKVEPRPEQAEPEVAADGRPKRARRAG